MEEILLSLKVYLILLEGEVPLLPLKRRREVKYPQESRRDEQNGLS